MARLVREALNAEGVGLNADALALFVARLPKDRGVARQEIERLILFLGPRSGVTADACGSGQVVSVGVKSCMSGQTTTSFGQIPDELKCSAAAKLYTKGCLAGP